MFTCIIGFFLDIGAGVVVVDKLDLSSLPCHQYKKEKRMEIRGMVVLLSPQSAKKNPINAHKYRCAE